MTKTLVHVVVSVLAVGCGGMSSGPGSSGSSSDAGLGCCPANFDLYTCQHKDGTTGQACHNPAMGCASSLTCGQGCDPEVTGRCQCVQNVLCVAVIISIPHFVSAYRTRPQTRGRAAYRTCSAWSATTSTRRSASAFPIRGHRHARPQPIARAFCRHSVSSAPTEAPVARISCARRAPARYPCAARRTQGRRWLIRRRERDRRLKMPVQSFAGLNTGDEFLGSGIHPRATRARPELDFDKRSVASR